MTPERIKEIVKLALDNQIDEVRIAFADCLNEIDRLQKEIAQKTCDHQFILLDSRRMYKCANCGEIR